jgi:FkbM family methyltransferase
MITSITALGQARRDFIYDAIADMAPRLCVDIGAAAGHTTRRLSEAMSAEGRVIAYEPFPGNLPHFRASTSELTNVALVEKAVSEKVGATEFYVDSVVHGTEPGWQGLIGYSSVGHLRTERFWPLRKLAKQLRRSLRNPAAILDPRPTSLRVETTSLDTEFPRDAIDFIKIDVQGAEGQVLRGARRLLDEQRVGLLYVEWAGDPEVVDILERAGYALFDSTYVGVLRGGHRKDLEQLGFRVHERVDLSVGRSAYEMTYTGDLGRVAEVLRSVRRRHRGWIQTDLIAVSPALLERFESSARKCLGSR